MTVEPGEPEMVGAAFVPDVGGGVVALEVSLEPPPPPPPQPPNSTAVRTIRLAANPGKVIRRMILQSSWCSHLRKPLYLFDIDGDIWG
jgi:hypothetical protein